MYRIQIDRSLCSGFGACAELAPDVIELDASGNATARVGVSDDPAVLDAAAACPMAAITDHRGRGRHDAPRSVVVVGAGPRRRALRRDAPRGGLRRRARARRRGARSRPTSGPALSKEFLAGGESADDLLLATRSRSGPSRRIELVLGERVTAVDRDAEDRDDEPRPGAPAGTRSSSPPAPGHGGFRSHRLRACTSSARWRTPTRSARSSSRAHGSPSSAAASSAPRSPRPPARSEST